MMQRPTNSGSSLERGRLRSGLITPRRRFLLLAAGLSIAAHLFAALLVVYGPRVLPHEVRPQEQGTVELLMVERKGADLAEAAAPAETEPAPPPKQTVQAPKSPPTEAPAAASQPAPAPPVAESVDPVPPPPAEQQPTKEAKADAKPPPQPTPPPSPPKAPEAPVFDLAGTESESNAEVLGGHVIPASPDNRFRNRPPIYPYEAAIHGDHGSVLLLIRVSDAGLTTGVQVVESSGVVALDQAAIAAVRKWRFRPALREGRAVPFDMPFRFVFEAN
jgi:periplasmic protein TonB